MKFIATLRNVWAYDSNSDGNGTVTPVVTDKTEFVYVWVNYTKEFEAATLLDAVNAANADIATLDTTQVVDEEAFEALGWELEVDSSSSSGNCGITLVAVVLEEDDLALASEDNED